MNRDQIAGNWKRLKATAQTRWGQLTDDDLATIDGSRDRLIGRLEERYGIGREEASRQADEWERAAKADGGAFR
ncbi:MAG: CsbD family protein [Gemmatimonas sp.]